MATVVREARAALDSPQLLRRFRSGSAPRRVQLEPLDAEPSPRRGAGAKGSRAPLPPRGSSQPPRRPRTPDSKPPEREIQHLEKDDEEAAAVLEDLDAFRQSLEEQDSVLTGLATRKAELQNLLEESRYEAKELSQAIASLEPKEEFSNENEEDELQRAKQALGLPD
eukprot:symbB.v1.2.019302.t1/scaffold1554.1/size111945/8